MQVRDKVGVRVRVRVRIRVRVGVSVSVSVRVRDWVVTLRTPSTRYCPSCWYLPGTYQVLTRYLPGTARAAGRNIYI